MANISLKKGTIIYKKDSAITTLSRIVSGKVKMNGSFGEITLSENDVLGVCDLNTMYHSCTYIAVEDTVLSTCIFKSLENLPAFLSEYETFTLAMLRSSVKQICTVLDEEIFMQYECTNMYNYLIESYEEYKELCKKYVVPAKSLPGILEIEAFQKDGEIPDWFGTYYEESSSMLNAPEAVGFFQYPNLNTGYLLRFSEDFHKVTQIFAEMKEYLAELSVLLLNKKNIDFFDLYTNLLFRAMRDGADTMSLSATISTILIHIEGNKAIDKSLYDERVLEYKATISQIEEEMTSQNPDRKISFTEDTSLENSLDTILKYAECDNETALSFKRAIADYKKQVDKSATTDEMRVLRREISRLFYEIYAMAFQASLCDKKVPTILKMFFKFGYVDEDLAGADNAAYLYSIADSYQGSAEYNVYTIYDWLLEIYKGNKEPRRNEFDVDYAGYVHEMKVTGKIDAATEKALLTNPGQKVLFEIQNMFTLANKMTSGRITTFTPVFSEHTVLSSLESVLVTPEKIAEALIQIEKIDYSAFYRDTLFYDASLPVQKEMVQKRILPDIILMPNVGNRSSMWQELEGKSRTTPACFIMPAFSQEDIQVLLVRMTGEYRWEICRRTQGARWNDLSDPSLTSEYCDYIQFYKKNNELSPEAKEKIKTALTKARNSFKEMFVRDYIIWVLYEGKGSPRMNKLARKILFTYCPFPKEIRDKLISNPLYGEVIEKWKLKKAQEIHRFSNAVKKIENSGKNVPEELRRQQAFLEM